MTKLGRPFVSRSGGAVLRKHQLHRVDRNEA